MSRTNEHGQPIGDAVDWSPRPRVAPVTLEGRTVRLEPLAEHHVDDLAAAFLGHPELWTYSPSGPYADRDGIASYVAAAPRRRPPTCRSSSWWTAGRSASSA